MINKTHLRGVDERANHHAKNCVESITLSLGFLNQIGAEIKNHRSNIFWFKVDNQNYVIAYNHNKKKIEVRSKNQQGECVFDFDDNTPYGLVKYRFNQL